MSISLQRIWLAWGAVLRSKKPVAIDV
jgi:hypothetical protein